MDQLWIDQSSEDYTLDDTYFSKRFLVNLCYVDPRTKLFKCCLQSNHSSLNEIAVSTSRVLQKSHDQMSVIINKSVSVILQHYRRLFRKKTLSAEMLESKLCKFKYFKEFKMKIE